MTHFQTIFEFIQFVEYQDDVLNNIAYNLIKQLQFKVETGGILDFRPDVHAAGGLKPLPTFNGFSTSKAGYFTIFFWNIC